MLAAGLDTWAVLSGSRCGESNVVTLVFTWLVTIVFYGFQKVTAGTFFGFVFGFVFYSFWACAYGGLL